MFPGFSINNMTNCSFADFIHNRYALIFHALMVKFSNFQYILFRQLRVSILCSYSWIISTLLHHISHVISLRTQKKMGRITARRIVALMQAAQPIWNFSIDEFPRKSMCLIIFILYFHVAISTFMFDRGPIPAIIRATLVNFFPESILKEWGESGIIVHDVSSLLAGVQAAGCFGTAAALIYIIPCFVGGSFA